ncbi:MAG: hypothetical protein ACJAXK_001650 [Yoonia sp.]|jgi:hypothetical protein
MKKLLLPIILLLLGVGSGVGAGLFLFPPTEAPTDLVANPCGEPTEHEVTETDDHGETKSTANEYVKLNNQFIVPIVDEGRVSALVVISLNIEVAAGNKEPIFLAEPKLRDAFLQAMFDHANIGGFSGNFTSAQNLRPLREDLARLAKSIVPGVAKDVLIMDIVRQDV